MLDIILFLTISFLLLSASIYLFRHKNDGACHGCDACKNKKCHTMKKAINDFKSNL